MWICRSLRIHIPPNIPLSSNTQPAFSNPFQSPPPALRKALRDRGFESSRRISASARAVWERAPAYIMNL